MSYQQQLFWRAFCDRCGKPDNPVRPQWANRGNLDDHLTHYGWHAQDGNHICPDCLLEDDDDDFEAASNLGPAVVTAQLAGDLL